MAAEIPVFRPLALAIVLGCAVVTMAESDASTSALPKACTQINSQLVSCSYNTPSGSPAEFRVPAGVSGVIAEICVQDTEFVEYAQTLFRVRPA